LVRAGIPQDQAAEICRSLDAECQRLLSSHEMSTVSGLSIKIKKLEGRLELSTPGHSVKLSLVMLHKLQQLYRGNTETPHSPFYYDAFRMLLRYAALGGPGFQAGLPAEGFLALQRLMSVEMELFASPLNTFHGAFRSAFPDVDGAFGCCGNFFSFHPRSGSFEANPPFSVPFIDKMLSHLEALLADSLSPACRAQEVPETRASSPIDLNEKASREKPTVKKRKKEQDFPESSSRWEGQRKLSHSEGPLSFAVVVPAWPDNPVWPRLQRSRFLRASLLMPKEQHVWRQAGAEEILARRVPVSTGIFFLQNDLGAREWPVTPQTMETLRLALTM